NGRIAVGSERAIKWRQQTIYGPTWFTTLLDNPPLGNQIAVRPQAVDGIVTVGFAHGSLSSTANTPTGIRRNWHAIQWVGTTATDMHVAASLNSVLGADSESYLWDISGAVLVGTAHGSPYGPIRGVSTNVPCYPGHATRWTTSNGLTTALDLNQFLPASSTVYETFVRSVAKDGSILGSRGVWGAVPFTVQPVLWKPLFDHTSFRLNVPREATAYILNAHIQRSGSVSVYGKMHLGRTDAGIYTVNGGSFGGDGLIYGSIDNNSGLLLPGSTTQVLRVDGNVRLGANSRFQVRYTPTLLSSGPITLGGTLQITSPPPAIGTRRSILVSMNGIQGKFSSVPRGWVLSVENGGIFHTLVGTYTGL
ncbi:MAG: hypothetical protein H8F28_23020, partial [Fibrella sp.]|nr:hypothetical protein [Armatimonadota bacterium]